MEWKPPTPEDRARKAAPKARAEDVSVEDIKQAIATLIRVMDAFGDAPWPLFERLVREYEERTEREELRERYREITKEYARP